jgi:hypothetical protein
MIKYLTSLKAPLLWVSLTSNVFLVLMIFCFSTGKIQWAPTDYVELLRKDR